jgi:hypothetical protein
MELFDVVQLVVDMPEDGLRAGMVGTIVEVHQEPRAYEVEFCDNEGRMIALLALQADQIRPFGQM